MLLPFLHDDIHFINVWIFEHAYNVHELLLVKADEISFHLEKVKNVGEKSAKQALLYASGGSRPPTKCTAVSGNARQIQRCTVPLNGNEA